MCKNLALICTSMKR